MVNLYQAVFAVLVALALSAFFDYLSNQTFSLYGFLGYLTLSIIFPQFLFMLPLLFYDLTLTKYNYISILSTVPIIKNIDNLSTEIIIILLIISILEILMKFQTVKENNLINKYIKQRDDLTEVSIQLGKKIREVRDKQDIEVNLATLNERNRIAREIHDNVGHLLSSSIIQIGAVVATTKEESTKESLNTIKKTLDSGMDSIRNSVHDLHDDSIDLSAQLNALVNNFTFCSVNLNYEINSNLQTAMKYAIIAIVKEALANVMKHSKASLVTITLNEHPKLIQLIILDNGKSKSHSINNGMGIENIRQRVYSLNGIARFDNSQGFRIFISFPKFNKED